MYAMVLEQAGARLRFRERPDPIPAIGEVRIKVAACGICRTDLHVVDGELPDIPYPIIPGHEVVGRIDAIGAEVSDLEIGIRVGVPWLGSTCGHCPYCLNNQENLCDHPQFTGYTRDGGFASHLVADARYCFPLGRTGDDPALAPLLCAGLIGWRSLVMTGEGRHIGIYGFGAAGHIIAQIANWQDRHFYAFTRKGDVATQRSAPAKKSSPSTSATRRTSIGASCPLPAMATISRSTATASPSNGSRDGAFRQKSDARPCIRRWRYNPRTSRQLADIMLASHHGAELSDGSTWSSSVSAIIDRNTEKFRNQRTLANEAVERRLHFLSHQHYDGYHALLRQRAARGLVRRCHGDTGPQPRRLGPTFTRCLALPP